MPEKNSERCMIRGSIPGTFERTSWMNEVMTERRSGGCWRGGAASRQDDSGGLRRFIYYWSGGRLVYAWLGLEANVEPRSDVTDTPMTS
jgi:hypothetical protein